MKRILVLSTFVSTILLSDTMFNYQQILNEDEEYQERLKISQQEKAQEHIKKEYGVSVSKQTMEDLKAEYTQKTLEVGFAYRVGGKYGEKEYFGTGVNDYEVKTEKQSNLGLFINGKIDLSSIGQNLKNVYGNIDIFDDQVEVGVEKRITMNSDGSGLIGGVGAGISYQIKDTVREKGDTQFYLSGRVGYNMDNFGIHLVSKYYGDSGKSAPNLKEKIGLSNRVEMSMRF